MNYITKVFSNLDISIINTDGSFRTIHDVMSELTEKWDELEEAGLLN